MEFRVLDLGLTSYQDALALQSALLEEIIAGARPNTLLLLEHPPVITLGANFHLENLILTAEELEFRGIEVIKSSRGGDVTYHGPGQLIAYPLFHLSCSGQDLHKWLRDLEEVVITAIRSVGQVGRRFPPHTGVWIGDKKVCAMGVKVRRWISMHGLALNCSPELTPFEWIVPCGIREFGVTSLSREAGRDVSVAEMKDPLIAAFLDVFAAHVNRAG